jgi:hypothetical protein
MDMPREIFREGQSRKPAPLPVGTKTRLLVAGPHQTLLWLVKFFANAAENFRCPHRSFIELREQLDLADSVIARDSTSYPVTPLTCQSKTDFVGMGQVVPDVEDKLYGKSLERGLGDLVLASRIHCFYLGRDNGLW